MLSLLRFAQITHFLVATTLCQGLQFAITFQPDEGEVSVQPLTAEDLRLEENRIGKANWRRWGPYVSDRSWGTVREDYSPDGNAWSYFTHDHARSRAYRWGEDAIAGFCDRYQLLVMGWAFWNEKDNILKERLFGVNPWEANHGEDVKEYYFYLDCTPTHSYQKMLYKYPQGEYPYLWLIEENRRRTTRDREFELLDTGLFDQNRYFDIFIEYAKASPEDLCIRVEVCNRGPQAAAIHLLPHLWFRNRWSWKEHPSPSPVISIHSIDDEAICLVTDEADSEPLPNLPFQYLLGKRYFYAEAGGNALFTNNESNLERLYHGAKNHSPYVKDAFHRYVVHGEDCVNPEKRGSKSTIHYNHVMIPAHGSKTFLFRLTDRPLDHALTDVHSIVDQRKEEADAFYARIHPPKADEDEKRIQRQAFAGMLWSKQIYLFDVNQWLEGDNPKWPPPPQHQKIRNYHWRHLNSMRIMSMPDKWEYPWFAAWDLAFHTVPIALVDIEFAKEQLWLLLFEQFQHPNGQIPAYEWEYSDLNPPVHAWAILRVYQIEKERWGREDRAFLEKCFHKLLINFAWWVNKVDATGNNLFEGGFLGLDNITVVDRSEPLGQGTQLLQSDATGWMGMFCLDLMRIALELTRQNPAYSGLAVKFFEHFIYIGAALNRKSDTRNFTLWSPSQGFFYDVLVSPDGSYHKFRVRSLVGLIPLYAMAQIDEKLLQEFPDFRSNFEWFLRNRTNLTDRCVSKVQKDGHTTYLLKLVNEDQMKALLSRVADPSEFHSDYGIRSLSKFHEANPFRFRDKVVSYEPAEAITILKGGNSNWRGPIWFPTTFLLIESFKRLAQAYGHDYVIPGSFETRHTNIGMAFNDLTSSIVDGMINLFKRNDAGTRAVYGKVNKFQTDEHWKDYILFHEYFHADTGEGLGASHQTGWTGLIATIIDEWRR